MRKRKIFVPPLKTQEKKCYTNNDIKVINDQRLEISKSDFEQCSPIFYKSICKPKEDIKERFRLKDIILSPIVTKLDSNCIEINENVNTFSCNIIASLNANQDNDSDKLNFVNEIVDDKFVERVEPSGCGKLYDFKSIYGNFKIEFSPFSSSENDNETSVGSPDNINDVMEELTRGSSAENLLMCDGHNKEFLNDLTSSVIDIKNGTETNISDDHSAVNSHQISQNHELKNLPCLAFDHQINSDDIDLIISDSRVDDEHKMGESCVKDACSLVESLTDILQEFKESIESSDHLSAGVECNKFFFGKIVDENDQNYDLTNTNLSNCEVIEKNKINVRCSVSLDHNKDFSDINHIIMGNICGDSLIVDKSSVNEINDKEIISNSYTNFDGEYQTETFSDDSTYDQCLSEDHAKNSHEDFIKHSNKEFNPGYSPYIKNKIHVNFKERNCHDDFNERMDSLEHDVSFHGKKNVADNEWCKTDGDDNDYKTGDDDKDGHVGMLDLEYSEFRDLHCVVAEKKLKDDFVQDRLMPISSSWNYSPRDFRRKQSNDSRWMRFVGRDEGDEVVGVHHLIPFS